MTYILVLLYIVSRYVIYCRLLLDDAHLGGWAWIAAYFDPLICENISSIIVANKRLHKGRSMLWTEDETCCAV